MGARYRRVDCPSRSSKPLWRERQDPSIQWCTRRSHVAALVACWLFHGTCCDRRMLRLNRSRDKPFEHKIHVMGYAESSRTSCSRKCILAEVKTIHGKALDSFPGYTVWFPTNLQEWCTCQLIRPSFTPLSKMLWYILSTLYRLVYHERPRNKSAKSENASSTHCLLSSCRYLFHET